tara:strand:- start:4375 stop:4926 length:552 start_codon:yes stop_codon:yes gene_type:complete
MLGRPKKRDREDYAGNASKRHREVGELLSDPNGAFARYKVFQEVSVKEINPDHPNHRSKVDWYLPDLRAAIEVQGEQHYDPVDFGGEGKEKATLRFVKGQLRDVSKALALAQVGVALVEISPDDEITEQELVARITTALQEAQSSVKSPKRDKSREQRRQHWKTQYKHAKAARKQTKGRVNGQ